MTYKEHVKLGDGLKKIRDGLLTKAKGPESRKAVVRIDRIRNDMENIMYRDMPDQFKTCVYYGPLSKVWK